MQEIEVAKSACLEAGKIALKYFRKDFAVRLKGPVDVVTQADIECEREIKKVISSKYPSHSFLGEEEGKVGSSDSLWVIDPIDGTTNFVHGVDQFCHSVALVEGGEIICGAVFNPVQKKLYTAQRGSGAFLNGKKIYVSRVSRIEDSLLVSGFPYDAAMQKKTFASTAALRGLCQDIRRFGSAALDLCYIAEGACDAFFEYVLRPWDVAAGILIVREAGGEVTDINGKTARIDSG